MKYIIRYKEHGKDWGSTSYTSQEIVTEDFLASFFGLGECEDYTIEEQQ